MPVDPSLIARRSTAVDRAATNREVDAVLAASRALVGVAAKSLAPVEDSLSVNQFRALVIIASRGPMHSAALAEAMGLHPSNATRTCDKLVADGLLDRRDNPTDRRHLLLSLTTAGQKLVGSVTARRRKSIREILQRLSAADRMHLARAFAAFAEAAGEVGEQDLWPFGWITNTTVENSGGAGQFQR